ncbi:uncharacterized protein LOC129918156 [Episyrphus balteatus]|uniref:uncharacterized protein LOC129918156 n=1 Tax=Episyrphus balteatus TaxID=286459 RepID=UPI0024868E71|nr:uncharacterized protein LOC129918156 [Episyrphus balteatus]
MKSTVLEILSSLNDDCSVGPDGVPPILLKNCRNSLSKPLTYLFELSIKSGKFPIIWKSSFLIPIFKKGDKTDIKNYRPISKLSCIPKIFEQVVCESVAFFSKNLVCEQQHVQFEPNDLFLQRLVEHLQHFRFCKIIFLLENSSEQQLKNVFNFCWKNRMVNVIAVFQDFGISSTYFSYSNFGKFQIEEFTWNREQTADIFPNQMRDVHGEILSILFGGAEPGVILSKNPKGDTIISGYMGNIFNAFVKKHNAKLNTSNVKTSLSPWEVHELVLNGTIEISAATDQFSEIHWKFFFTPGLIFNIDCFRGMIGQGIFEAPKASYSKKIIYSLIFLLGILMVTTYDAFLQSFMTEPPKEKMIKSYDDLLSSGLKVYILRSETKFLFLRRSEFMQKYQNVFEGIVNLDNFTKIRDTLNTKHAYTSNNAKWKIYENQRKFFGYQLFRWSEELCLLKSAPTSISMNENSIYRNVLNWLLLQIQSAGLMEFWTKRAFYELIEAGKIQKLNVTSDSKLRAMKVDDLKWIWILWGMALMIAALCFIGEICIFRWKM